MDEKTRGAPDGTRAAASAPGASGQHGRHVAPAAGGAAAGAVRRPFSTVEVFSRPADMVPLLSGLASGKVVAEVLRPRMMSESVEHGRGRGPIKHYTFRRFKDDRARAVLFVATPRGVAAGSFEPPDRLLRPGEQLQLTYRVHVEAAGRGIFLMGKGYFLRKSYFVAATQEEGSKPWVGSREDAATQLPKHLLVTGEEVLEVRTDTLTAFPQGPGSLRREVLDQYLGQAQLYIIPGGTVWNQKSTQGSFFDGIREPLERFVERQGTKCIGQLRLEEFGNLGDVSVTIRERLLSGVVHEVARPAVERNPNEHVREINSNLGFLLHFRVSGDIAAALVRGFPQKAGRDDDVYLPLLLERVNQGREQSRVIFRVFPRDLVEDRARRGPDRGLRFLPPYALHQGAENHTTYSKLLIALSTRFREDQKPDEEKLKSDRLVASVQSRIAERRHEFVDANVRAAFSARVAARRRREDEGES